MSDPTPASRLGSLGRAALPVLAIVVFALAVGATLAVAGDTLGYDYRAYVGAAQRFLDGGQLYDPSADVAGPFAVFLYPPPFALAFVPFALAPDLAGTWAWIILSVALTVGAIALMPVRRDVRWLILLLAGLDWPVVYAIKLGQVGPLLLLLFVVGWRFIHVPTVVGVVGALGTLVKLQPGLLLGWALLRREWRTVVVGGAILAVVGLASIAIVGIGAWSDYAALITRVSAPVTTPHSVTPGAIVFQAGWSQPMATGLQVATMVLTVVVWIFATLRRPAEIGYIVTIVASQMLSPIMWDHYAMLLLLPVALLLQRGHIWAVLVPLATSLPLVGVIPDAIYPLVFVVCLIAPIVISDRVGAAATTRPLATEGRA